MMRFKFHFLVILLSASLSAGAMTTYTYTGVPYTTIEDNSPPAGTYTGSMFVSGSFTVAAPLGPDFLGGVSPSEFSFFDGRTTLTHLTADGSDFFIGTDGSGNIDEWFVAMGTDYPSLTMGAQKYGIGTSSEEGCYTGSGESCIASYFDFGEIVELIDPTFETVFPPEEIDFGLYFDETGTQGMWATSAIPVPGAVWLFGSALGVLGWLRRRR